RLIWGARVSLGVAFLTVAMSLTLGTTVGMVAGYYGGWIDDVLMRLVDTVLAIPAIFLFILMAILFRPNAFTLAAIVASVGCGNMLTNAQSYFFRSGFLVALPGITIFVTVLASNMFGNAVRDAFDPRLKS